MVRSDAGRQRQASGVLPGGRQEAVEAVDRMAHEAVVDVEQVFVGVEAGGALQQSQRDGTSLAAAGTAHEEEVLPAERERADRILRAVVVDFQTTISGEAGERLALVDSVANGFGNERRRQHDAFALISVSRL